MRATGERTEMKAGNIWLKVTLMREFYDLHFSELRINGCCMYSFKKRKVYECQMSEFKFKENDY